MAPFIFTLLLLLVPYQISAHSPCSRKGPGHVHCVTKCKQLQNWAGAHPGMAPGQHRWGEVMKPGSFEDILSKACGHSSPTISDSVVASPTVGSTPSESPVDPISTPQGGASSIAPVSDENGPTSLPVSSVLSVSTDIPLPTETPSKSAPQVSPEPTEEPEPTKEPQPTKQLETTSTKQSEPTRQPEPQPSPSKVSTPAPSPTPSSPGAGTTPATGDQAEFLKAHNDFRAHFPIPPLKWSDKLAGTAQQWANNCQFQHSGGKFGSVGENLAAGAGGGYNIASAIKSWTDEEKDYNPRAPAASHFTQVVWKSTTEVGCAKAMCDGIFDASFGKSLFVVCQYNPPGNFNNEYAANVLPRSN